MPELDASPRATRAPTSSSVGKLHFRSTDDDNGFSEELAPMHILNGKGGVSMLLRWSDEEPVNAGQWGLYLEQSQRGREPLPGRTTARSRGSRSTGSSAARRSATGPWVLFVSYVSPHPPFTVPQALLDSYPAGAMPLPPLFRPHERPAHPALDAPAPDHGLPGDDRRGARCGGSPPATTRSSRTSTARSATVLRAAESLGLLTDTRVAYTSDHGEALGAHGLFGKYTLLDPSAAIPLVMCGPGVPHGPRRRRAGLARRSLSDAGRERGAGAGAVDREWLGVSLLGAARSRGPVFAEYHAAGSRRGAFMLLDGPHKLIYHVDAPRQLFDLAADPDESRDLAATAAGGVVADRLEARLRTICDPRGGGRAGARRPARESRVLGRQRRDPQGRAARLHAAARDRRRRRAGAILAVQVRTAPAESSAPPASARPKIAVRAVTKRYDATAGGAAVLDGIELAWPRTSSSRWSAAAAAARRRCSTSSPGWWRRPPARCSSTASPVTGPGRGKGVVFQAQALFPWLTAIRNIEFGARSRGLDAAACRREAGDLLALVGLAGYGDRYPAQLSGGMQQRVAIARALAQDPQILLMDEPFGALDEITRIEMQDELLRVWSSRRKTVLFVTHSITEALMLSDRVVVMGNGGIVAEYTLDAPRPRRRADPRLASLHERIWEHLR